MNKLGIHMGNITTAFKRANKALEEYGAQRQSEFAASRALYEVIQTLRNRGFGVQTKTSINEEVFGILAEKHCKVLSGAEALYHSGAYSDAISINDDTDKVPSFYRNHLNEGSTIEAIKDLESRAIWYTTVPPTEEYINMFKNLSRINNSDFIKNDLKYLSITKGGESTDVPIRVEFGQEAAGPIVSSLRSLKERFCDELQIQNQVTLPRSPTIHLTAQNGVEYSFDTAKRESTPKPPKFKELSPASLGALNAADFITKQLVETRGRLTILHWQM